MDNKNNSMPDWNDFFPGGQKDSNGGGNKAPRSFLFYVFIAMIITLMLNTFVFPAVKQARIEPADVHSDKPICNRSCLCRFKEIVIALSVF